MGTAVRSRTIGASALLAIIAAALMTLFAFFAWGGGSENGLTDGGRIKGVVEWTHRDASGAVLGYSLLDNTILALIKDDSRDRLGVDATTLAAADFYDEIALCSNDAGGIACTLSTVANITENNPQEGAGVAGSTGVFSVALTFTATGAVTIEELQLVKGTNADGEIPTASEIGAWQNVSVTLANTDTIQITWTVTIA